MKIPRTIEDITPQWLTEALKSTQIITDEVIVDLQVDYPTDEDGRQKGIVSKSYQLKVQYDRNILDVPQSFFVKLSNLDWVNFYQREVNFYQNFAQDSGVRTPHCYYSDIDLDTGAHILLLEDMSDARCWSMTKGYSLQEAEQAIVTIAKFHARWWGKHQLKDFATNGDPDEVYTAKDFQADWDTSIEKIKSPLPDSIQAISQQMGTYIEMMYAHHGNSPQTLVHFDYHLENLLFPTDGSPMIIIDWQLFEGGIGVYDVVYNMITSLNFKERRQHEIRLLRLYHDTLIENGVTDYSFETCYQDYVLGFFRCMHLFTVIFLFDLFDSEAERLRWRDMILPNLETFVFDHKNDIQDIMCLSVS